MAQDHKHTSKTKKSLTHRLQGLVETLTQQTVDTVQQRWDAAAIKQKGHETLSRVLGDGERLIERSPVPLPQPVLQTIGRMHAALDAVGQNLESTSASPGMDVDAKAARKPARSSHGPQGHKGAGKKGRHARGNRQREALSASKSRRVDEASTGLE